MILLYLVQLKHYKEDYTKAWDDLHKSKVLFFKQEKRLNENKKWNIYDQPLETTLEINCGCGYFTCIQNMKLVTNKFNSGGLHEKHVVATWNVGNHLSVCL